MKPTRRSILRSGAAALTLPLLPRVAAAQAPTSDAGKTFSHALSLFGEIKYPPGFAHFDYVNPNAPKGGTVRMIAPAQSGAAGTFDNFNSVVSGIKGTLAAGVGLIYDALMTQSADEISTEYGLIAEAVSHPDDYSAAIYRLRPNPRWHDGKPVTPADVIFAFEVLKEHNPFYRAYYGHVVKVEQTGERDVTFIFDAPGNRELPHIIGQLSPLPKHWWEGSDASGRKRDVTATTLEVPLGCGAYRVKEFTPGRSVVLERVKDYWGAALNVNVGQNNFDEFRFEYFRDSTIALEAFKADQVDWRTENSATVWRTAYDFPAVHEKRVILEEFPTRSIGRMQGLAFNLRRGKFADPRLRQAFNYAYDFEEMNQQLFGGQYQRINSYFEGIELASSGLPQGQELEILESVRDKVPPEVFTTPFKNPVGGTPENVRNNRRQAFSLLKQAGYDFRGNKLVDAKTGEPFKVELLSDAPSTERIFLFLKPQLERIGLEVSIRTVDDAQYQNRLRQWDYDMVVGLWGQSLSPGNEQREFWGSQAADQPGSRNLVGIKNPAVDALIERVIFAKDREELVAACKALDRVLLWNHYVVPQFTYNKTRTARWDRFGRPAQLPKYNEPDFPGIWWWDAEKAAKAGRA